MSLTIKLYGKNGEEVVVWNDLYDPQYIHFTGLGYTSEKNPKKVEEPKEEEDKTAAVDLEKTELMKLSRADLLQVAVDKELAVKDSMSKAEIVGLLITKA